MRAAEYQAVITRYCGQICNRHNSFVEDAVSGKRLDIAAQVVNLHPATAPKEAVDARFSFIKRSKKKLSSSLHSPASALAVIISSSKGKPMPTVPSP